MSSTPTGYDPRAIEAEIDAFWESGGYFNADAKTARQPYVIAMPPPNVTGALHLGHALYVLHDLLIRWKRMSGYDALYMPGLDHAGIATQAVVEKRLFEDEKKTRHDIGREALVKRIWAWKDEYGQRIDGQLRKLGLSADWRRERFTLDEYCGRAVYHVFFELFKAGLIYRGLRLVNWDAKLQTAVADDEIVHETVKGSLWHIRYPIEGSIGVPPVREERSVAASGPGGMAAGPGGMAAAVGGHANAEALQCATAPDAKPGVDYLVVATTRPETMLADTAVAVHPDDERYKHLIGKHCILPLMGRRIPIIADPILVKKEFGTGCVKVTPGHDPNDHACWQRHPEIGCIDLLTPDGKINENGKGSGIRDRGSDGGGRSPIPDPRSLSFDYSGLPKEKARKQVVADLESLGLLEKVEPYETEVGHSDRSKTPIEPLRSEQWFVKMDKLAELAMEAVRDGRVEFHPSRYASTYLDWLGEKRDWCISRQLWWGHRIPVWTRRIIARDGDWTSLGMLADSFREHGVSENYYRIDVDWALSGCAFFGRFRDRNTHEEYVCVPPEIRPDPRSGFAANRYESRQALIAELENEGFEQDPDVLDTWFSSALWPFSTLGWPHDGEARRHEGTEARRESGEESTSVPSCLRPSVPDFNYFFPSDVLCTGRGIITLWVARMVMTSLYFTARVPFKHVYINPTIQDGLGRTMSKSLGNGVDPLDIIELYGTDALRFTMTSLAGETQDIRMPVKPVKMPDGREVNTSERFEAGRNFVNKLWQASTGFVLPNVKDVVIQRSSSGYHTSMTPADSNLFDRWIRARLNACIADTTAALEAYEFQRACELLRSFFWGEFCDWYLEEAKVRLALPGANDVKVVMLQVLDVSLCLLHPIMPFVTEAIWQRIGEAAPRHHELIWDDASPPKTAPALIVARWPRPWAEIRPEWAGTISDVMQPVIRGLRDSLVAINTNRSASKQGAIGKLPKAIIRATPENAALLNKHVPTLLRLGRCEALEIGENLAKPPESLSKILTGVEVYVPVTGLADLAVERKRLEKERDELAVQVTKIDAKLSNEGFVAKAPAAVIEQDRARLAEFRERLRVIEANLREVGG